MPRSWFDFRIFIRVSNRIFLEFCVRVSSCSSIKPFDYRGSTVYIYFFFIRMWVWNLESPRKNGVKLRESEDKAFRWIRLHPTLVLRLGCFFEKVGLNETGVRKRIWTFQIGNKCKYCVRKVQLTLKLFHQPTLMHNFLYSLTICLLHYYPRHFSSINMPIFRRKNCIHTASGIFALRKRLHSTLVESGLCIKAGWWNNSILWCTVEKTSNAYTCQMYRL